MNSSIPILGNNSNININSNNNNNNNNLNEVPNLLKSSFSNLTSSLKDKTKMFDYNENVEEMALKKPNFLRTSQTLKDIVGVINSPNSTSKSCTIIIKWIDYSVLSLVVHSTWGNLEKVGLTEVQIFDKKSKKIDILECHVFNGNDEGINK